MAAWFGDARGLSTQLIARIEAEPARLLSPALNLAISLPLAILIGVPTAGVGAGVLIGALVAAVAYFATRRRERAGATRLEQAIANAWIDADQRVALVTKQYEWAVNDVANLRDALRRTQARAMEAERLLHAQRRGSTVVPLVRRPSSEDAPTTLRFETDGLAPDQVRILEGDTVVGISARAMEPGTGETATFLIRVSEGVASGIATGDERYALEGLLGEEWRRVVIRREHNVRSVSDKRGRVFAAPTNDTPLFAIQIAPD